MTMTREEAAIAQAATAQGELTATPRETPIGYPRRTWVEDPAARFYVEPRLRPDYLRARVDFTALHFEGREKVETAHQQRLEEAKRAVHNREYSERERRHTERPCPSCGAPGRLGQWKTVYLTPGKLSGGSAQVCVTCAPLVERALVEFAVLPDGRTRRKAAEEFTAALLLEHAPASA